MIALNWSQVNTWRLSQHHLLQRAAPRDLGKVVTRIGGVQAQLMSAAELSLWARVEGLKPADVQNSLWRDRSLIKTWAMRGTLHLLEAGEFPLYVAARAAVAIKRPPSYYSYHGVTPEELAAILVNIPEVLSDVPMTREQLASAVAERSGSANLREVLLSGWGALLKPSAFRGDICFGPNQGQNVTFVRPDRWIPSNPREIQRQAIEPAEALKEMARRYLNAYGPATAEDFGRWWGIQPGPAKKVFKSLGDEVVPVDVEGWKAWALGSTIEQIQTLEPAHLVRLLPQFDAYTVGISRDCEPVLANEFKSRVYRSQGWISAVVLIDGRIDGTWDYDQGHSTVFLKVDLFQPASDEVKNGIQAEAKRLSEFLGAEIEVNRLI
jgi:hypothetical protein